MEFQPEIYQHSAGLILYYDNMNYINLRKYYSQTMGQSALSVVSLENGVKTEYVDTRTPVEDVPVYLRLYVDGRESWFEWSYDGTAYQKIGRIFHTAHFSDEYCKYGEFTGTMAGLPARTECSTDITRILISLNIKKFLNGDLPGPFFVA